MSIAVLGPITFEVNQDRVRTWQEARSTGAGRWVVHEVYQGKPRQEFIGPGLQTLSLQVRLDRDRGVNPRDELRRMRQARDTGEVMQFTVGGSLVGDYVLKELAEEWRRFSRNGVLMVAIVNLSLEEYA